MLRIPGSVQTLFKTDGVRKNFRAQFPNGELPDITNSNIVKESLHFTESLCSQNTFRFGLAEASVLEFETVGVGNMYGMTIKAYIEIDVTSLTAAQIADIEAGTWDGELVDVSNSDTGYAYFRVPLGVFRVESCPRNHGAMTHRKVTAYSAASELTSLLLSPVVDWQYNKIATYGTKRAYISLEDFINSNLAWSDPSIVSRYTKTPVTGSLEMRSISGEVYVNAYLPTGSSLDPTKAGFTIYTRVYRDSSVFADDKLYSIEMGDAWPRDVDEFCNAVVARYGGTYSDEQKQRIKSLLPTPLILGTSLDGGIGGASYWLKGDAPIIYMPASDRARIACASGITLNSGTSSGGSVSYSCPLPTVYELTPFASPAIPLTVAATGTTTRNGAKIGTYIDAFDFEKFFSGWVEIFGDFARTSRLGGTELLSLAPATPSAVNPGDYEGAWWDEYDVAPIGSVNVSFNNTGGKDQVFSISVGDGASVYDMTDNAVINMLDTKVKTAVTNLIQGDFAANAANVGFTPIYLTMRGWPWLEAGDALEITAEDGTVVNTYALRVEMSGIQHLTSVITAEGGEIVGEV